MKIGVNSRIFQNQGAGIPYFIKCLYDALQKMNPHDRYIFFQTNKKKTLGSTYVWSAPGNIFGSILFDGLIVKNLADSVKVDIFHGPSNVLPLYKNPKIKYVVTIHDLSFLVFPKLNSKLFNLYYKFIVGRSIRNADVVIADSNNTKKDIKKFYDTSEDKIKVIHLGINPIFLNARKTKRIIKEKYFFSITTHPKRKNIFGVLEAIAINRNLQKYKYVIVGSMSKGDVLELEQEIKKLRLKEKVILFGYASEKELISLYQNAEFFVFPSFYEGFGFPVLEAMVSKCPVITSSNSSLVEIASSKEWLIDPYDANDISDKMNKILKLSKLQRKKMIEINYKHARKFSWEKTVKKYMEVFNNFKLRE